MPSTAAARVIAPEPSKQSLKEYFVVSTTSGRVNTGLRDAMQRHGYAVGEFKPGGIVPPGADAGNAPARARTRSNVAHSWPGSAFAAGGRATTT